MSDEIDDITAEADAREKRVMAIAKSIHECVTELGMDIAEVVEGAHKGAAIVAVCSGMDLDEAAGLFEDFADALRHGTPEADRDRVPVTATRQ